MSQTILYGKEARKELLAGVKALSDVVSSTLGPSGHSVILGTAQGQVPVATKDGITVAQAVKLDCPIQDAGAAMLRQASSKTADEAGDGTTTSTVIAAKVFELATELESKHNSVEVRKGMDKAVEAASEYIGSLISKPVSEIPQLKQIATISANGDKEIGTLVSKALNSVGLEGAVTVEESKTGETYLDIVEGVQFDRGYKSPYFVTDNETMTAVLEDVVILMTTKKLTTVKEVLSILEGISQSTKSLLIIADDVDGELLSALVLNKLRAGLKVCAVKAPEFGDRKKETLEDIAVLTGGTVVSTEKGMNLERFDSDWFGEAAKVVVDRDKTTIIGAKGDTVSIGKRIEEIQTRFNNTTSTYDKEQLQNRLARLAGGVAVMYVGGHTEVEMRERKDRVDDALHATRAALEEGVCPGGGRALLAAALHLAKFKDAFGSEKKYSDAFIAGVNVVQAACIQPFRKILSNAGVSEEIVENLVAEAANQDLWNSYLIDKAEWGNMYDEGIIDPTKVVRLALRNAVSAAGTMATSEAVLVNIPEKHQQKQEEMIY